MVERNATLLIKHDFHLYYKLKLHIKRRICYQYWFRIVTSLVSMDLCVQFEVQHFQLVMSRTG